MANEASYAAFLKKREGSGKPVSEKLAELYKNKFNDIPRHQFDSLMKAVEEYRKAGYQFPKEFDHYGFKDALAEMAEENADAYAAWLRKTFDGLIEKKGIRNLYMTMKEFSELLTGISRVGAMTWPCCVMMEC